MKVELECYSCLINQAYKTAKLLEMNHDDSKDIINKTMEFLLENNLSYTAPHIASRMNDFISDEYFPHENFDPYKDIKYETNITALKYLEHLNERVSLSNKPLDTAIKIAAAGNIIDFGAKRDGKIDIEQEIKEIDSLSFEIFNIDKLSDYLSNAKLLLYIGDNAGEIVFDRVLIQTLKRLYPGLEIVFAVRHRPIINDATLVDAKLVGLDKEVKVISSGSIYPGTVLNETSEEFKDLFKNADVIISKGQGNFETMSDLDKENLFFILRVKCEIVGDNIGAEKGSLILKKHGDI